MSKTAPIPDDIHELIVDEQTRLKRQHKITVRISDIIALVMKNNIHKVEKYLGITGKQEMLNNGVHKIDDSKPSSQHTGISIVEETEVEA